MTLTQRGAAPATSIPDEVVDEVELDRVVRAVAAKATEWAHTTPAHRRVAARISIAHTAQAGGVI